MSRLWVFQSVPFACGSPPCFFVRAQLLSEAGSPERCSDDHTTYVKDFLHILSSHELNTPIIHIKQVSSENLRPAQESADRVEMTGNVGGREKVFYAWDGVISQVVLFE